MEASATVTTDITTPIISSPQRNKRKIDELIKFIEKNELKLFYNEFITPNSSPNSSQKGLPAEDDLLSQETFHELCNDLVEIIERCIGPSEINIKEEIYMKFLTIILPKIVDIFLKRKTSR